MRRLFLIAMLVLVSALFAMHDAEARWSGSGHSSGGHKSSGNIIRKCKTDACFKKHPSGHYSVPLKKKR